MQLEIARPAARLNAQLSGEMETRLRAARLALRDMVQPIAETPPSAQGINRVKQDRALVVEAAWATGCLAIDLSCGEGFLHQT